MIRKVVIIVLAFTVVNILHAKLNVFHDWIVVKDSKLCMMYTAPESSNRAKDAVMLNISPYNKTAKAGIIINSVKKEYFFKKDTFLYMGIEDKTFQFITYGNYAYYRGDDKAIIDALRNGSKAVIKYTSSSGAKMHYTFSLKGSTAAFNAFAKLCKIHLK